MLKDRKNFFEILETAGLRPETANPFGIRDRKIF